MLFLYSLKHAWGKNLGLFSTDEEFVCRLPKHHVSRLLLHLFNLLVNCLGAKYSDFQYWKLIGFFPFWSWKVSELVQFHSLIIYNCWIIHKKSHNVLLILQEEYVINKFLPLILNSYVLDFSFLCRKTLQHITRSLQLLWKRISRALMDLLLSNWPWESILFVLHFVICSNMSESEQQMQWIAENDHLVLSH